eukprot:TRINITY_DN19052_c0_g2_i3.p1 TRINITY_DN19052_c0_g2~~TRINITY_DN19052_c0_g2_i3.p1  ORF type:complete len:282 (+),score=81.40 TRINITY_DN19052_c0_g2_i3:143-988(+)
MCIRDSQNTGQEVAVKVISKDQDSSKVAWKEVEILRTLAHRNVVGLLDVGEEAEFYYIVMELCRGDLFDRIELCGWFDEEEALHYMTQLAAGVAACHASNIVHRDLKPENLLLDSNDVLKITDFGLASAFSQLDQEKALCGTPCGSPRYAAPQVVQAVDGHKYDAFAADVWSMGICCYIMTMGQFPFSMADPNSSPEFARYVKTQRLEFPERGSLGLEQVLHGMLALNECERPSPQQLHEIWSRGSWATPSREVAGLEQEMEDIQIAEICLLYTSPSPRDS